MMSWYIKLLMGASVILIGCYTYVFCTALLDDSCVRMGMEKDRIGTCVDPRTGILYNSDVLWRLRK